MSSAYIFPHWLCIALRSAGDDRPAALFRYPVGFLHHGSALLRVILAAERLYRHLGFREVGAYRQVGWKFDRWLDVTLMQLDLSPEGAPPTGPGLDLGGGLA